MRRFSLVHPSCRHLPWQRGRGGLPTHSSLTVTSPASRRGQEGVWRRRGTRGRRCSCRGARGASRRRRRKGRVPPRHRGAQGGEGTSRRSKATSRGPGCSRRRGLRARPPHWPRHRRFRPLCAHRKRSKNTPRWRVRCRWAKRARAQPWRLLHRVRAWSPRRRRRCASRRDWRPSQGGARQRGRRAKGVPRRRAARRAWQSRLGVSPGPGGSPKQ